jgi:hypothetical protein
MRSGWKPGRQVEVDGMLHELALAGHTLVAPVAGFLREFSGLTVVADDGHRRLQIDGYKAARLADLEWCAAYARGIGRSVTPVGEQSHMLLLMDESGAFWGGFDDLYGLLGDDIIDLVSGLLVGPPSRRLDRVVSS